MWNEIGNQRMGSLMQSVIEFTRLILAGLVGGLIGAYTNDRLTRMREKDIGKDNRKRSFRGFLKSESGKIEAVQIVGINEGMLFAAHQSSVSGIREECAKILDDIPDAVRAEFERISNTYCSLRKDDVEPYDVNPPPMPTYINYSRGQQHVLRLLNQMIDCAK